MDIYLDENVPDLYDSALLTLGWRSVKARDAGNKGKSDAFQFKFCADNDVPLITLNEGDFVFLSRLNRVLTEWQIGSVGHGGILTHKIGDDHNVFIQEVDALLKGSKTLSGKVLKLVSGTWHEIKQI